jgi:hypothetical protein
VTSSRSLALDWSEAGPPGATSIDSITLSDVRVIENACRAAVMNGSLVAKLAAQCRAEWMICVPLGHMAEPAA